MTHKAATHERKMRILLVAFEYRPFPGGQATYAYEMACALSDLGHKVTVIAPRYATAAESEKFTVITALTHQSLSFRTYKSLCRALKQTGPFDKILSCDIRASLSLSVNPFIPARKIISMYHGGEVLHGERNILYRLICKLSAWRKSKLVANSKYSASLTKSVTGHSCLAIPLGVSSYWFERPDQEIKNPTLKKISQEKKLIFCLAARLERRKGHLQAIESIIRCGLHKRRDFAFIFSGKIVDEEYHEEILSHIKDNPETLIYTGELSRNDVRHMYAMSDLLLLLAQPQPYHIEGFGLVITEAGAQKCPVLTTSVGGIPDAVVPEESGIICAYQDIAEIDRQISRIASDRELREKLSIGAQKRAARDSWTDVALKTMHI